MTGPPSRLDIICSDPYLLLTSTRATRFKAYNYELFATDCCEGLNIDADSVCSFTRKPNKTQQGMAQNAQQWQGYSYQHLASVKVFCHEGVTIHKPRFVGLVHLALGFCHHSIYSTFEQLNIEAGDGLYNPGPPGPPLLLHPQPQQHLLQSRKQ
jgi:hypothetical protein